MKIKTGDKVRVLTGREKGKEGTVLQVFSETQKVVIDGLNIAFRHLRKRSQSQPGQKIQFPSPLHISNIALLSEKSGKAGRVGYRLVEKEGKKEKIRVIRSKGTEEDIQ